MAKPSVIVRYQGLVAVLVAAEDYTAEDWDLATDELVARSFLPMGDDPIHRLPDGTEIHIWQQFPIKDDPDIDGVMHADTILVWSGK